MGSRSFFTSEEGMAMFRNMPLMRSELSHSSSHRMSRKSLRLSSSEMRSMRPVERTYDS